MNDFPEYSAEGKAGLAFVHAHWAYAVFYFEDSHHETFYERLIRKLLPEAKPFLVVCLGGKSEVIKQARTTDAAPIPEICVLDKDFDDLLGAVTNAPQLVYLRRHSIENYLCQIDALVEIALEQCARAGLTKVGTVKVLADHAKFHEALLGKLLTITRLFVVAQRHRIPIASTKTSCDDIFDDAYPAFPIPEDSWIDGYRAALLEACAAERDWLCDAVAFAHEVSQAFVAPVQPWGLLGDSCHIVGKQILSGLVRYVDNRLDSALGELDPIEFYTRLVGHASLEELSFLRQEFLIRAPELQ